MEFRSFLKTIARERFILLLSWLIGMLFAFIYLSNKPISYDASLSIITNYTNAEDKTDNKYFAYNNYYGTLVAESFSESIRGLLKNDGIVREIFDRAGLKYEALKTPGKFFRVTAKSKYVLEIRFREKTRDAVDNLANSVIDVLKTKAVEFSQTQSEGGLELGIEGPTIMAQLPPILLYTLIIMIVMTGFGLLIILLMTYLKDSVYDDKDIAAALNLPIFQTIELRGSNNNMAKWLPLREFLLSSAIQHDKLSKVGILSIRENLSAAFSEQLNTVLKERSAHKSIEIAKLPGLYNAKLTIKEINQMNQVVIVLPDCGMRRQELKTFSQLLIQVTVPKLVILTT